MAEEGTAFDLVELQKRLTDAVSRRELAAIAAFFAPDAAWDMSPTGTGVFEGHAAIRGFWEDWFASYEEYEVEAEEILDLGNGVSRRPLSPCHGKQSRRGQLGCRESS